MKNEIQSRGIEYRIPRLQRSDYVVVRVHGYVQSFFRLHFELQSFILRFFWLWCAWLRLRIIQGIQGGSFESTIKDITLPLVGLLFNRVRIHWSEIGRASCRE